MNFIIPLVIFPFDIMFSFAESDKKLHKNLLIYGIEDCVTHHTQARTIIFNTGQVIIRLKELPITNKGYGILQHEIFHAAQFVLSRVGINLSDTTDEIYAYLIQYLTEQVYNKLSIFPSLEVS